MRHTAISAALALTFAACGGSDSPTSPSPTPPVAAQPPAPTPAPPPPPTGPPDVNGNWRGSLTLSRISDNSRGALTITMALSQDGRNVTGAWTAGPPNDIRGEVRGTLTGPTLTNDFAGTLTWEGETGTGTGRCRGTMNVTGTAEPSALRWMTATVEFGGTCQNDARDLVFALQRQ